MAGGLFFLGQAVASANDQVADASTSTVQDNSSTDAGGGEANVSGSSADATNVDVAEVETDIDGGNGGSNSASVNTGVINEPAVTWSTASFQPNEHEKQFTSVTFNSGDVTLTQNANGGGVSDSGNVAVAVADSGNQTATATATVEQSNSSEGDDHHDGRHHEHDGDGKANVNDSSADATNIHKVDVDTDIHGGNGGDNYADINTGIIGNTFHCSEHATCTYNFHTGNVNLVQNANGGSVSNSGNVGVGAPVPGVCECPKPVAKADCPEGATPAAEVKAAVKPAAKPAAKSAARQLSSAQPSGQLAFTGSDVSLPLTVGLLALAAGIGLTAAGRRRETQTV
jgi:hypothetical protein